MDVFKNLYPDQDVPEGLLFDKVTFKHSLKCNETGNNVSCKNLQYCILLRHKLVLYH